MSELRGCNFGCCTVFLYIFVGLQRRETTGVKGIKEKKISWKTVVDRLCLPHILCTVEMLSREIGAFKQKRQKLPVVLTID